MAVKECRHGARVRDEKNRSATRGWLAAPAVRPTRRRIATPGTRALLAPRAFVVPRAFAADVRLQIVLLGVSQRATAVVVLVTDPDSPSETTPSKLQRLFGLSPSEARLASKLAQGKGLREVADELQIGYTTARTHLQHLFDKLQVRRQSELVAVLLRAIGPFS